MTISIVKDWFGTGRSIGWLVMVVFAMGVGWAHFTDISAQNSKNIVKLDTDAKLKAERLRVVEVKQSISETKSNHIEKQLDRIEGNFKSVNEDIQTLIKQTK